MMTTISLAMGGLVLDCAFVRTVACSVDTREGRVGAGVPLARVGV